MIICKLCDYIDNAKKVLLSPQGLWVFIIAPCYYILKGPFFVFFQWCHTPYVSYSAIYTLLGFLFYVCYIYVYFMTCFATNDDIKL